VQLQPSRQVANLAVDRGRHGGGELKYGCRDDATD
jgi:hypothetical protein